MQRLLSHQSVTHLGYLRGILEAAGIGCFIKNERLSGALGEIPFLECWPELWIIDVGDLAQAEQLLGAAQAVAAPGEPWRCSSCGEMIESQFVTCWQCGTDEPAADRPHPAT